MPARLPILLLALLLSACAPAAPSPVATSLATLDPASQLSLRPLQLLKLEPGTPCPRAHGRQVNPAYGIAIGDGPVYAAGFGNDGILNVSIPAPTETPFYGSEWSGARVLWLVDPAYRGPILIRGGRLDGSGPLRFDTGAEPLPELRLDPLSSGSLDWRSRETYTRLRAPGCYMYQVDGLSFTETIIFEAKSQP